MWLDFINFVVVYIYLQVELFTKRFTYVVYLWCFAGIRCSIVRLDRGTILKVSTCHFKDIENNVLKTKFVLIY